MILRTIIAKQIVIDNKLMSIIQGQWILWSNCWEEDKRGQMMGGKRRLLIANFQSCSMQDQSKTMTIKKFIVRSNQRDGTIIEVIGATRCWLASTDVWSSVTLTDRRLFLYIHISFYFFRIRRRDAVSRIADSMSWSLDYVSRRLDRGTNDNPRCLSWFIDNKKYESPRPCIINASIMIGRVGRKLFSFKFYSRWYERFKFRDEKYISECIKFYCNFNVLIFHFLKLFYYLNIHC